MDYQWGKISFNTSGGKNTILGEANNARQAWLAHGAVDTDSANNRVAWKPLIDYIKELGNITGIIFGPGLGADYSTLGVPYNNTATLPEEQQKIAKNQPIDNLYFFKKVSDYYKQNSGKRKEIIMYTQAWSVYGRKHHAADMNLDDIDIIQYAFITPRVNKPIGKNVVEPYIDTYDNADTILYEILETSANNVSSDLNTRILEWLEYILPHKKTLQTR